MIDNLSFNEMEVGEKYFKAALKTDDKKWIRLIKLSYNQFNLISHGMQDLMTRFHRSSYILHILS